MGRIVYETTQVTSTGLEGSLSIGTTPVELKVGSTIKSDRTSASLFNNSTVTIYWGYTNSVTVSTGTPIYASQFVCWEVEFDNTIFLVAATNGNDVRITEVS